MKNRPLRTAFVGFRASANERALVKALACAEERTESDVLRRLVREAARARGLALLDQPNPPSDQRTKR